MGCLMDGCGMSFQHRSQSVEVDGARAWLTIQLAFHNRSCRSGWDTGPGRRKREVNIKRGVQSDHIGYLSTLAAWLGGAPHAEINIYGYMSAVNELAVREGNAYLQARSVCISGLGTSQA